MASSHPLKLKLKVPTASQPATPTSTPVPVTTTKAGRTTKPSAKVLEARKRPSEDSESDIEPEGDLIATQNSVQPSKRIKILPGKASVRIVQRRTEFPRRTHGEGYDSEASDCETDPVIEEQLIFRMPPGPDCDYIKQCLEERNIPGHGMDFQLKFLDAEGKHVLVKVRNQFYAATLLNLPTTTEAMKTFDRKAFLKSGDICQILLVIGPVNNEVEAKNVSPPSMVQDGQKWPHGLTPPMHDCVNRRFRKTVSRKEIQTKEKEVEQLLAMDDEAIETSVSWEKPSWATLGEMADSNFEDEDAAGEDDPAFPMAQDGNDDELALELENAFNMDGAGEENAFENEFARAPGLEDNASGALHSGHHDSAIATGEMQSVVPDEESNEDEEEDDGDEDEDDEEDEDEGDDQDNAIKEEIRDLEAKIAEKRDQEREMTNPHIKKRIKETIKQLELEVRVKKRSIGMADEDT